MGLPAHAADEDDVPDVGLGDLGVPQSLVARVNRLLDEVGHDALKLGPSHL